MFRRSKSNRLQGNMQVAWAGANDRANQKHSSSIAYYMHHTQKNWPPGTTRQHMVKTVMNSSKKDAATNT